MQPLVIRQLPHRLEPDLPGRLQLCGCVLLGPERLHQPKQERPRLQRKTAAGASGMC